MTYTEVIIRFLIRERMRAALTKVTAEGFKSRRQRVNKPISLTREAPDPACDLAVLIQP